MFQHLQSEYPLGNPWGVFLHLVSIQSEKSFGICEQCGSPMPLKTSNGQLRRFCGRACSDVSALQRKKDARKALKANPNKQTVNCLWCNAEILARTTNNQPRRFCGPPCCARYGAQMRAKK